MILAMDRPWIEAGLKWAYVTSSDVPSLLVQRVSRLRGTTTMDTFFLRYVVSSQAFTDYVRNVHTGTSVPHISATQIENFPLALPPLPIQRRIASILSAYDDLIENNTRRIAILEEMAQAIYREWFVHFRYPGHEDVPLVDSALGPIPEGWQVHSLVELADVTYGYPFKSKQFSASQVGKPVIRIRDVKEGRSSTFTDEVAEERYIVRNGDLLVGMDGEFHMGKWVGGDAYLNQRVARFTSNGMLSRYHLFLALTGPIKHLESTITGTTVAHLSARDIKAINTLVPAPQMLKLASEVLQPMFDLEQNLRLQNMTLRKTRDLLLPKLISGEIDVSTDVPVEEMEAQLMS